MKKLILILFIILYSSSQAIAQQFPIAVVPQVNLPAPVHLFNYADVTTINGPLRVQLLLNDITISNEQIRLKVYFEGNGIAFESNDVVIGAPSLFIDGGVPLVLTNAELAPYFELQNIKGINSNIYGRAIPEGSYQFCFEVYDYSTANRLSSKNCITVYIFKNEPPILNLPLKGSNIEASEIDNIVFQWTPRHINVSNVAYEFSIVEIWDDRVDPQTAFLSVPPIFETTTRSTSFVYGPTQPLLLPEKRYAWRVQAKALQGSEEIGLFRNEGKSEVFWFSRTSPCDTPTNVYAAPKGISKINVFWDEDPLLYQEYTIAYREANKPNAYWFTKRTNSGWATIWDLKPGTTYEYKVKAKCKYQYGPYSGIEEVTTETTQDETANYNCGIVPDPIAITNREPHPELQIGNRITAGDFVVTVVEIESQSNGRITGRGFVKIPYLKYASFGVKFDNILINTDKQLAEGEIITLYDPEYGEGETMTVDIGTEVAEVISEEGGVNQTQVGFQIESITVDEKGTVVVTGVNGEEAVLPEGSDIEIVDSNGKVWTVNEEGTIQDYGEIAEGGTPSDSNTEGVADDDIFQISATNVLVTFKESGYYHFDPLPKGTEDVLGKEGLYPSIPIKGGGTYTPPFKAISNLNGNDIILAEADFKDDSVTTEDIVFKTESGILIPATWDGTVATLILKKAFDGTKTKILATVKSKEEGGKQTIAGVLNLVHLGSKELQDINVVLIPVNDAVIHREVETKIEEIYSKAGIQFKVTVGDRLNMPDDVWRIGGVPSRIDAGDSEALAGYSPETAAINRYFMTNGEYNKKTYYIFITNIKGSDSPALPELEGFMPYKNQFGYVFNKASDDAITAARILGHGVFGLEHAFTEYGTAKNTTNFLMDYSNGSILNHMDWEKIYAPGVKLYEFRENEVDIDYSSTSYFKDTGIGGNSGKTNTFSFLTPTGELIVLPENVANVHFYYGYYGESLQGDVKRFMNFTPGTLKSFKIDGRTYEARVEFLQDNTAKLLGYFAGKENPIKFDSSQYKAGIDSSTPIIMSYDGKDFVLARLVRTFDKPMPKYDSSKTGKLKKISEFPRPAGGIYASVKVNNYSKYGSSQYIITNQVAKSAYLEYVSSAGAADVFIRNKIAELKAAFPVLVDNATSKLFDKWDKNKVCSDPLYSTARSYKFISYLSDTYCDCDTGYDDPMASNLCTDKPGVQILDTKIEFLLEYLTFLQQTVDQEMPAVYDALQEIRNNVDVVNDMDKRDLVKLLNFATIEDIKALESEHVIRILSRMAYEGIFEMTDLSQHGEEGVLRLIENINPKIASEVILGLESPNIYNPDKYLYKQIFHKVDDKIFGFISGDNNRVRLITSFAALALQATDLYEERKQSLSEDIDGRIFVLEYRNIIKRTAIDAIEIIDKLDSRVNLDFLIYSKLYQEWTVKYNDIDVDYDPETGTFVGVQQEKRSLYSGDEVFRSKKPLKPFDLVYFMNKSNIDVVKEVTGTSNTNTIMPAILLMFADVSATNQTIAHSIIATMDVITLSSGVGTLVKGASGIHKAVTIFDIGADMASLSVTALSDTNTLNPAVAQFISDGTLIYSVIRIGMDVTGFIKDRKNLKIQDLYDNREAFPDPPPVSGVLDDLDRLTKDQKRILVNDPSYIYVDYYLRRAASQTESADLKHRINKQIDESYELIKKKPTKPISTIDTPNSWKDNLPTKLVEDFAKSRKLETLFEKANIDEKATLVKAWEVLSMSPQIRGIAENIEILARVSTRFEYQKTSSFDGLRKLLAEGSPASKQKSINGLNKMNTMFDADCPVVFSGTKNGQVKASYTTSDGTKVEIARINKDGKLLKNVVLGETKDVTIVGKYRGVDILKNTDGVIGFRLVSARDMQIRLRNFPELRISFTKLDKALKSQFIEDFASATNDVFKQMKDEKLFDVWKNNVRSANPQELRNAIANSTLRNDHDTKISELEQLRVNRISQGIPMKDVARTIVDRRRAITIEYRDMIPDDLLEWVFKRNDIRYTQKGTGNRWGATYDELIEIKAREKGIDLNTPTPSQLHEIYQEIAKGASKITHTTKKQQGESLYTFFENAKNQGKISTEEFNAFVQVLHKYRMR
ncbi:fibronectin type III domain-containing protein [Aquimarina aquimarini]|uniref:fibronectin type III domain-containing protein n=1 Tax=Aquimarina aquimarini TaxID=1191734 RepID=UPI000D55AB8F|nr:fibronectin type III domain-containing protein [Aquimarina aquimarini]